MQREGTLLKKEAGLKLIFQGKEHPYVHCIVADIHDPERSFECRVIDEEDISIAVGEPIKLDVLKVITDRRSGVVYFDCRLSTTSE